MEKNEQFFNLLHDAPDYVELKFRSARIHNGFVVPAPKSYTLHGFFSSYPHVAAELERSRDVTAYFGVNPIPASFPVKLKNTVGFDAKENFPSSENIKKLRWMLIDVDPEGRPSDSSASDSEAAACDRCLKRILACPSFPSLAGAAAWGSSGNGRFVLVRLPDLPAVPAQVVAVKNFLALLNRECGGDGAVIDFATYNAMSSVAVPGSKKCKGIESPGRPWRPVEVYEINVKSPFVLPILKRADCRDQDAENRRDAWARRAVLDELHKIETATSNRHIQLNKSTYLIFQLVAAGVFDHAEAMTAVRIAAERCGLPFAETESTIEKAARAGLASPRRIPSFERSPSAAPPSTEKTSPPATEESKRGGRKGAACDDFDIGPHDRFEPLLRDTALLRRVAAVGLDDAGRFELLIERYKAAIDDFAVTAFRRVIAQEQRRMKKEAARETAALIPDRCNPHFIAREFLRRHCTVCADVASLGRPDVDSVQLTYVYWNADFYEWNGVRYDRLEPKEVRAVLTAFAAEQLALDFQEKTAAGVENYCLRPVTYSFVSDILQALAGDTLRKAAEVEVQPSWLLDRDPFDWRPIDVLQTKNKLVHLPSFIKGDQNYSVNPTPLFFSPYSLDYDFTPEAPPPVRWLAFLDDVFRDDPESIAALQEWFGYLLLPDTRLDKILFLFGPKRSGKGTIIRVLSALIGKANVSSLSLMELATQFGLSALMGKSLLVIPDARLSRRPDLALVVENLLTISGNDMRSINRKHESFINYKLSTRCVIVSNVLPELPDSSLAITSRIILIEFKNDFYGKENINLTEQLLTELPGILLWATEGWKRLCERGRLTQPQSGMQSLREMGCLSSPIGAFVEEMCEVSGEGDDEWEWCDVFYATYQQWAIAKGLFPASEIMLARDLKAVARRVYKKYEEHDGRVRGMFMGIRLTARTPFAAPEVRWEGANP